MTPPAHPVYRLPAAGVVAGAIYLHVPVTFRLSGRLPVLNPLASGLVQIAPDFDPAWHAAPPAIQAQGLPVAVLAKPRPVLVLRVGAVEDDPAHRNNIWVVPLYSAKERPRMGRNLFRLPAWQLAGLSADAYLDFFQGTSLPVQSLRGRPHPCDLQPAVLDAVLAKFRTLLIEQR